MQLRHCWAKGWSWPDSSGTWFFLFGRKANTCTGLGKDGREGDRRWSAPWRRDQGKDKLPGLGLLPHALFSCSVYLLRENIPTLPPGSRHVCATNWIFHKETVCCEVAGRSWDQELVVLWAVYWSSLRQCPKLSRDHPCGMGQVAGRAGSSSADLKP